MRKKTLLLMFILLLGTSNILILTCQLLEGTISYDRAKKMSYSRGSLHGFRLTFLGDFVWEWLLVSVIW